MAAVYRRGAYQTDLSEIIEGEESLGAGFRELLFQRLSGRDIVMVGGLERVELHFFEQI